MPPPPKSLGVFSSHGLTDNPFPRKQSRSSRSSSPRSRTSNHTLSSASAPTATPPRAPTAASSGGISSSSASSSASPSSRSGGSGGFSRSRGLCRATSRVSSGSGGGGGGEVRDGLWSLYDGCMAIESKLSFFSLLINQAHTQAEIKPNPHQTSQTRGRPRREPRVTCAYVAQKQSGSWIEEQATEMCLRKLTMTVRYCMNE